MPEAKVYEARWSRDYGWSWAVRLPSGAWCGGTNLASRESCERGIADVLHANGVPVEEPQ